MSSKFKEILKTLPDVAELDRIELYDLNDNFIDKIENRPGSQGSLKVYFFLYKTYKLIDTEAAKNGLKLFSEHTDDAKKKPGSHPNIDRLILLIDNNKTLKIRVFPR